MPPTCGAALLTNSAPCFDDRCSVHGHAQTRKIFHPFRQAPLDEHRFAVENVDVGTDLLAVNQKRHADLFHALEHAHDVAVVGHAGRRVGRSVGRIKLDADEDAVAKAAVDIVGMGLMSEIGQVDSSRPRVMRCAGCSVSRRSTSPEPLGRRRFPRGVRTIDVDRRRHRLPAGVGRSVAGNDLLVVGGIYAKKIEKRFASHFLPDQEQVTFGSEGEIIEILYAAGGFLLVHKQVYLDVQRQALARLQSAVRPSRGSLLLAHGRARWRRPAHISARISPSANASGVVDTGSTPIRRSGCSISASTATVGRTLEAALTAHRATRSRCSSVGPIRRGVESEARGDAAHRRPHHGRQPYRWTIKRCTRRLRSSAAESVLIVWVIPCGSTVRTTRGRGSPVISPIVDHFETCSKNPVPTLPRPLRTGGGVSPARRSHGPGSRCRYGTRGSRPGRRPRPRAPRLMTQVLGRGSRTSLRLDPEVEKSSTRGDEVVTADEGTARSSQVAASWSSSSSIARIWPVAARTAALLPAPCLAARREPSGWSLVAATPRSGHAGRGLTRCRVQSDDDFDAQAVLPPDCLRGDTPRSQPPARAARHDQDADLLSRASQRRPKSSSRPTPPLLRPNRVRPKNCPRHQHSVWPTGSHTVAPSKPQIKAVPSRSPA